MGCFLLDNGFLGNGLTLPVGFTHPRGEIYSLNLLGRPERTSPWPGRSEALLRGYRLIVGSALSSGVIIRFCTIN